MNHVTNTRTAFHYISRATTLNIPCCTSWVTNMDSQTAFRKVRCQIAWRRSRRRFAERSGRSWRLVSIVDLLKFQLIIKLPFISRSKRAPRSCAKLPRTDDRYPMWRPSWRRATVNWPSSSPNCTSWRVRLYWRRATVCPGTMAKVSGTRRRQLVQLDRCAGKGSKCVWKCDGFVEQASVSWEKERRIRRNNENWI